MAYIILDRDGVINHDSDAYIKSPDEWCLIAGSDTAIKKLNDLGFIILLATNQSGIARGYYSLDTLADIHKKMHSAIESVGGKITKVYFCPHGPDDGCDCRKPKTGLVDQARVDYPNLGNVFFVGDSLGDLQSAKTAGCKPILVKTGKGGATLKKGLGVELAQTPVFDDLLAFANSLI